LQGDEWQIERDLVLKKEKVYVPKDKELRVEIIWLHHNVLATGHRERWKMMELVMRNYWWLGVTKNVGKYVNGYDIYQRMKNCTEILAKKLMVNKVPERP